MTVNMDDSVKQARKRPFGAKLISTIGAEIRVLQSKSLISVVEVFTTTTELSEVATKTSGCRQAVRVRGKTAMAEYEKKCSLSRIDEGDQVLTSLHEEMPSSYCISYLANAAVGKYVTKPQKEGVLSPVLPPAKGSPVAKTESVGRIRREDMCAEAK